MVVLTKKCFHRLIKNHLYKKINKTKIKIIEFKTTELCTVPIGKVYYKTQLLKKKSNSGIENNIQMFNFCYNIC